MTATCVSAVGAIINRATRTSTTVLARTMIFLSY